jgi:hypothetical protein
MYALFIRVLSQALQAFMPVAVGLAWVDAAGLRETAAGIRRGILAAVPASLAAGYLFDRSSRHIEWEVALGAAAIVVIVRFAMTLRRPRIVPSGAALAATVLLVARETMMIGAVLLTVVFGLRSPRAAAVMGAACAVALACAYGWTALARRLPRAAVHDAALAFAMVFVALAGFDAFHKATELRLVPISDALHVATEPYGPDAIYGQYFSGALVAAPIAAAAAALARRPWTQPASS